MEVTKYLIRQKFDQSTANRVQSVIDHWKSVGMFDQSNKKDWQRSSVLLAYAAQGKVLNFWTPVCPDYQSNDFLGQGISLTARQALEKLKLICLNADGFNFKFHVLLADVEYDIPEILARLAPNLEFFHTACSQSRLAISNELGVEAQLLSGFIPNWHKRQYYWETKIRQTIELDLMLNEVAIARSLKYCLQFGRKLTHEECLKMTIRHYAQYTLLGEEMRKSNSIMLNPNSPNLHAVRNPLEVENPQRIPIVITDQ